MYDNACETQKLIMKVNIVFQSPEVVELDSSLSKLLDNEVIVVSGSFLERQNSYTKYEKKWYSILDFVFSKFGENFNPESLIFNSCGKPFLQNSKLRFSNTNSKETDFVALQKNFEIGVDFEFLEEKSSYLEIAQRFFHEDEIEYLSKIENSEDLMSEFYRVWTIKEALVKCLGLTMFQNMKHINISKSEWDCADYKLENIYVVVINQNKGFLSIASDSEIKKIIIYK